jgi:hypothetical protein
MSLHCLETGAYLDRATAAQQTFVSDSVLQEPLMVDKRPWLAYAFMELLEMQRVGRVEPGIGDFRITDDTLKSAGRVLCGIRHRYLPNPSLSTLSGGGVQITWTNGKSAVEISVLPDDDVALAVLVNDTLAKAVELRPSDYDQMNQCLADLVGL